MLLEISYPGATKTEFKTIYGETREQRDQRGWEYIYQLNKNRISVTLCSWLKQRMFGLKDYSTARSAQAARLLVLMNYHNQFHYLKMCKLIADNRAAIEEVAPGEQSRFYNDYKNRILPILEECDLMKGAKP
jgi:hypothetical protein